ncbi:MAG: hypothetical protein KKB21_01310 [Nanoarchaeota archaeon]|nr:hypothetical protein [Nanoarchaeota archaeon]MBU4086194.1 hypothetical protein [Nanoarchaeota archaeon]
MSQELEEGVFRNVFHKKGNREDDVKRAREAVEKNKGLLVLVRDLSFKDKLIAGTLVCYPYNDFLYALERFDGTTANFNFCDLSEMYV